MTPLDFILALFVFLFVAYLIVIAATEPRYTWRQIASFEELIDDFESNVIKVQAEIGAKIAPILYEFAKSLESLIERQDGE